MKQFYERYWEHLRGKILNDHRFKFPTIKKLLPLGEAYTILDYGCGNGEILVKIKRQNPKSRLIGFDVSLEALSQAKKRVKNASFYRVKDGERLPLASASVDFILALDVIEHIYDTELAFIEFSRVLKPGGTILMSTPYHGLVKNILIACLGFDTIYDPFGPHIRFFTKKSLFNGLERVGIRRIQNGYYGRFFPLSNAMYVKGEKIKK